MTYNQIKESAWKLFENDEINKRKINNLTKLQNNIEVRSKCLKDFINDADTELTELNDLRIRQDNEKYRTQTLFDKKRSFKMLDINIKHRYDFNPINRMKEYEKLEKEIIDKTDDEKDDEEKEDD